VVWPEVDCPEADPVVCPEVELAPALAVPAPADPAEPACNAAIRTGDASWLRALGFAVGVDPHWSATFVALVTLNSLVAPVDAPELIPEFPEPAVVDAAEVEALVFEPVLPDPSWPVTCISFPIRVRTAFKFPVSL
jgi:hypothetical protein